MDSRGMLDKLVANETLARMTRAPHFNAKSAATATAAAPNGFRNMLPPLTNGKTSATGLSSLSQSGGSKCSSLPNGEQQPHHQQHHQPPQQQPRRSVITLKSAPGPTVNSSGTGVLKAKPSSTSTAPEDTRTVAGRGPRSRKRSRDGDALDSSDPSEKKEEQSMSASEIVEPTKKRRRGKGSRKLEKKNAQAPSEAAAPRLRSVNSTASAPGILDLYGLRSKTVDLTAYELEVPLDKLLSGEFELPSTAAAAAAVKNEPADSECTNLIEKHLSNVMELLPKRTSAQQKLVDNAAVVQEDVSKVRLVLDLERPFQPEDEDGSCSKGQKLDDRRATDAAMHRTSSLDKKLQPFAVEALPLYACEEFRERLRLPENELETLITNARPTEHPGTAADKSSKFEGIPPSPASFSPVGVGECVRAPRNGRSTERHWDPNKKVEDSKPDACLAKADRVKEEHESGEAAESRDGGNKADCSHDTRNPEFPTLHVKVDDNGTSHHRHLASSLPATPYSPGVQAAAILLCNMANSDAEKEFGAKGKRQRVFPGEPSHRFAKVSKLEDDNGSGQEGQAAVGKASSKEVSTSSQQQQAFTATKKSIGSGEKRKSLSQVNHSLSKKPSLSAQTSPVQSRSCQRGGDGAAASCAASAPRSSSSKLGKELQRDRDRDCSKDESRLSFPLAACKWGSQAAVKSKELPQVVGKVKLVNGVTGSSPKSIHSSGSGNSNSNSRSPKVLPSRNDNVSRSLSSSKCSEAAAPPPRSSSSAAGVALKSSRRTSSSPATPFAGEVKQQQRSKHDLRASKLSREGHHR